MSVSPIVLIAWLEIGAPEVQNLEKSTLSRTQECPDPIGISGGCFSVQIPQWWRWIEANLALRNKSSFRNWIVTASNNVFIIPRECYDLRRKMMIQFSRVEDPAQRNQRYRTLDGFLLFSNDNLCLRNRQTNQDWVGIIISAAITTEKILEFVRLSRISFRVKNVSIGFRIACDRHFGGFGVKGIEKSSQNELRTAWYRSEWAGSKGLVISEKFTHSKKSVPRM